ncbi:MAG: hypothetical protein E7K72_22755 [Roseomonas mucosa]|nr:hypothetical protein [Roseomonas mucosa]
MPYPDGINLAARGGPYEPDAGTDAQLMAENFIAKARAIMTGAEAALSALYQRPGAQHAADVLLEAMDATSDIIGEIDRATDRLAEAA